SAATASPASAELRSVVSGADMRGSISKPTNWHSIFERGFTESRDGDAWGFRWRACREGRMARRRAAFS
ncbi:MAG: hypothetical protein ACK559_04550, partial [bacterium]